MTRRSHSMLPLLLGLALAGCGPNESTPPPDAGFAVEELRYTCGEFGFGTDILDREGNAERGNDPASRTLREAVALDPMLPQTGWIQVGRTATRIEYVNVLDTQEMVSVTLVPGGRGWDWEGFGYCQPAAVLGAGIEAAAWTLDPAAGAPGPEAEGFVALVTERACNSGQPADGRIVGPELVIDGGRIIVVFGVRPRPGGHTCPSNPATRVEVHLPVPLGDRVLLDGGTLPFADAFTDPAEPRR